MVEAIFELILSFFGELIFETLGEVLLELGFHGPAEAISDGAWNKILLGVIYAAFGGVLGWLSLLIFPKMIFAHSGFAIFYFVISPIVAGFALMTVSWLIDRGINNSSWIQAAKSFSEYSSRLDTQCHA